MLVDDRAQAIGDVVERRIPLELVPTPVVTLDDGVVDPSGVVVDLAGEQPLVAGEPPVTGWSWSGRSRSMVPPSPTSASTPQPTSHNRQ